MVASPARELSQTKDLRPISNMKTLAQLLQLSKNPYYVMTNEERVLLDDFLFSQSAQQTQQDTSTDSSLKTPANVVSKNFVQKHDPEAPQE